MFNSQFNEKLVAATAALSENNMEEDPRPSSPSSNKARSLSDCGQPPGPSLSPSPKFKEPAKRISKDDSAIGVGEAPTTPRRPAFPARGLSLQMPPRDFMSPNAATSTTSAYRPLSPKLTLDHSQQTYASPSSVLPRRSRGLDFSRAATNLHHSTLAESSPDSSPTITGRPMAIPSRKNGSHLFGAPESMNNTSSSLWSTMHNSERLLSGSLGSVNMMESDSDSSSDGDDMMDEDIDDSILSTPQLKQMAGPFGAMQSSPGNGWVAQSPAVSSLMNFQRSRLHNGRIKKTSRSGSGSSMASPISKSPPMRSVEVMPSQFLNREMPLDGMHSRRESISWAANQLHISGSESDDGSSLKSTLENVESNLPMTPGRDGQRPGGVIRRAVTRRGNMLPQTKGFARIRAALAEESAPVETEVRKEAEVIRQTRESDMEPEPRHNNAIPSSPTTGAHTQESMQEDDVMGDITSGLSSSFQQQAMRNSKGSQFWETFTDETGRTPPPSFLPRGSSSGLSEVGSSGVSTPPPSLLPMASTQSDRNSSPPRSATPQPGQAPPEFSRKVNSKRRREDDFDPTSFKRRAVSPGMSVHNSPVMQSPMQRDVWGQPGGRPGGNGDGKGNGMKRVGFQGMVDTNDSLMKMSIE